MLCSQAVALTGYVFFGSSVLLGDRVRDLARVVSAAAADADARLDATLLKFPAAADPARIRAPGLPADPPAERADLHAALHESAADDGRLAGLDLPAAAAAVRAARRFLLLDFSGISGMDATAAATFKKMSLTSAAAGVTLVLTGVRRPSPRWSLLVGNGVVARDGGRDDAPSGTCPCFDTLDDALAWCEAHFLQVTTSHTSATHRCSFIPMHARMRTGRNGAST